MEAQVIKSFLPDLVTAISDCVQPVSDQCLAKGLIPESVYKRVLESGGTSEDKARTLVLAVKKSTETDSRCLEILLNILEMELPFTIVEKLLSEIRKEQGEKANTCRAVVPSSQTVQSVPSEELPRESALVQTILLGKFEDSTRQHEHACAKRRSLEEKLKIKSREHEVLMHVVPLHAPTQNYEWMLRAESKECDRLTDELEALEKQNQQATSDANARIRITACEQEISALKLRVEELEGTPEGQNRQSSGGLRCKIEELSIQLQKAVEEMKDVKEIFQKERQKSGIHVIGTYWFAPLCGSETR
jgi:hypothetical protein